MSSSWRAVWRVPLVVAVCLIAVVGPWARPAAAHAVLVSSSPGDGARLEEAPSEVRFEFNEPVSAQLGGLRVYDRDGERVDRGTVRATDTTITIDLAGDLPDGAYVATYRVVSADAHPVRGGIVFTVGDGDATEVGIDRFLGSGSDRGWELAGAVGRWVAMLGALIAAGGAAFVARCHPEADHRLLRLVRWSALAGVAGLVAAVPVQAALATGQGPGALGQSGVLRAVLGDGLGWSTLLGVGGLAGVAWAIGRSTRTALAGAAVAVVSFALVGHTRHDDVAVGMVADAVHVGAAAVWVGGLVLLAVSLRHGLPLARRSAVVIRFSQMATISIVTVGAAGVVLSWTEVGALRALTSTSYGWTLLAKVALVAVVAVAGAYNHVRLVPRLDTGDATAAWRRLSATLRTEVLGVTAVLALTAVLVNLVPAGVAAGIGQLHSEILDLGDSGSVQVVVDPNQAGENSIHLYFYDPDGRPAEIAQDVRLELSKPGDDIGPIERTPFRAGPAHFQLDGNELISSGRWQITVVARLSRFAQAQATSDVLVGA